MIPEKYVPRLLGFAFVFVAILSLASGLPLESFNISLLGDPENISFTLVDMAGNPSIVRLSIVGYLVEASAIVFLDVLLYLVLKGYDEIIATWAAGLWLAEAVFVAIRQVGVFSLLRISLEYVEAGIISSANLISLGNLFYYLYQFIYASQMIFYTVGGILFYLLFYTSKTIPRWLSLWGVLAAALGFIGELLVLFGNDVLMFAFLPILPFELAIGIWLMAKGIKVE